MADDTLEVFIKIANPDIFEKLESLKNKNYTINVTGNLDKGLQEIFALRGRNIEITANPANAIASLKGLEASFKSVQSLANIKIKIDPKDAEGTLKAIQDKIAQLTLAQNNIRTAGVSGAQAQSIVNNPNFEKAVNVAPRIAQEQGRTKLQVQDLEEAFQLIDKAAQRVVDLKAKELVSQIKSLDPFQKRSQQVELAEASKVIQKSLDDAFRQQVEIATQNAMRAVEENREKAIQQYRNSVGNLPQGPFSPINQGAARNAEIERFRAINDAGPSSSIVDRELAIQQYRNSVKGLPQGPFSPINQKELQAQAFKDLGQATALGALQGQGLGSLGGSLLGGVAGALGGPGGVFLGSAVGGAIGQQASTALEKLTHALENSAEAGIQFESSLLGISSVLQANTTVRGADGAVLPIGEQLQFQGQQARSIQQAARSRLLPLGIAGEKEATLVQAIVAGSSQRGIQLSADQASLIAERLGGAIQAQRPELLQNTSQIRRDVEDLLSGLPNRTILSSLVKGFAPGIGDATSAEDLVKRTQGLAPFPEALKNSNNPVVALNQFNAALDNLNVAIGDKLVTTITPALKDLSKTISDPKFGEALFTLTGQIGTLVAALIEGTASITQKAGKAAAAAGPEASGALAFGGGGAALGALLGTPLGPLGIAGGGILGGSLGAIFGQNNAVFAQRDANLRSVEEQQAELDRKRKGVVTGSASAASRISSLLKETGTEDFNPDIQRDTLSNLQFQSLAQGLIPKALEERLATNKANLEEELKTLGPKEAEEARKGFLKQQQAAIGESQGQRLAANIAISGNLEKLIGDRQGLLDTSSPLGQVNQLQVAQPIQEALVKQAQERLGLAKEEADRRIANIAPNASPDIRREETIKAEAEVRAATDNLTKAFLNLINTTEQLIEAENQRARTLRDSQFDSGTVQGRIGLAKSGSQFERDQVQSFDVEIGSLRRQLETAVSPEDRANLQSKLEGAQLKRNQSEVQRAGFDRAAQSETIAFSEGLFKATEAIRSYTLAQEAARDKVAELADRSSRLSIQQEQLKLTSQSLDDSLIQAKRNLTDFAEDRGLRKLQVEGGTQSAAQNVFDTAIGAGFDQDTALSFLGGNVQSAFIKGSPDFDPQAAGLNAVRQAQERLRISQRSESRLSDDEQLEFNKLQREAGSLELQKKGIPLDENDLGRSRRALEREKELLPFDQKNRQFSTLKDLIGLQQQGIEAPGGQQLIQTIGKELGIAPEGLQKVQEAQTQAIEVPKNVADIAQTTKDILATLTGKPTSDQKKQVDAAIKPVAGKAEQVLNKDTFSQEYPNMDVDYITELDPMGALSPTLETIDPKIQLSRGGAGFNEDKRGAAFTGVDVFGGQLLPERKNKTNKERLEDKVDSILAREGDLSSAFAGSVYPDITKPKALPTKVLNSLSNISVPTPTSTSSETKSPDVVQAIKDGFASMEASFRKALESQL